METKEATSEKTDRPERRFHHKSKKTNRLGEDIYWECSVCTYQNGKEAFKCAICDVRKGTSTRPRLKNVDRDSAQQMAVTVGSVTVIITDFKLLTPDRSPCNSPERNSPTSTTDDIFNEPGPSNSLNYNILPPSPEMIPEST